MVMTLSDLRRERDERERQEQAERNQAIRTKLLPLLLADIRGELSRDDGLTLLELCDDCEIDEEGYAELQRVAKAVASDARSVMEREPQIEAEKLRFAKMTLARRRAEQAFAAAEKADRQQRSLRETVASLKLELERYRDSFPYLFDEAGEPLPEVVDLAAERPSAPNKQLRQCPICLVEYHEGDGRDEYCSSRCRVISEKHGAALVELGVLKKKGRKNG